jgi:dipeptidyl aminopeptidase/acylaminoacyl peptidase
VPPDRLRPVSFSYAYPLPGEYLSKAEPLIFEVDTGKRTAVQCDPIDIFFLGGPGFQWARDSKRFRITFFERAYRAVEYREVDAATGVVRVLYSERSDTFIDPAKSLIRYVQDGAELLLTSERDGWHHLYLYDGKSGQLKNQITKGEWVVRQIDHVDEKARQIYFLASGREPGRDPYLTHYYRVNFDGTDLRLLTPEDANHGVSPSPTGAFFVDRYSRPDLPSISVLRRASDGEIVMELEKTDAELLLKTGWKFPEPFRGTARDGKTEIFGLIWRPSKFDARKKYPVVEQIYTGPQSFFAPKTFAAYRNAAQAVAELGFIVVQIDGLGTSGRSKAFHNHAYKNLGDGGIPDHIALLRQMAAKYPYMDLTRVGVYGTSAGGYDSAHAMLTHPEFYKVGVSISGNHDHRMDKAWWNELWMSYPVGEHYAAQSNVMLAPKLEGKLLLVHGDLDDNVNVSSTLQFAHALMQANKDFDMLIVPNMFHGEGGNPYLIRRRWDYFVRHLHGVAPPAGYEIKRPQAADAN